MERKKKVKRLANYRDYPEIRDHSDLQKLRFPKKGKKVGYPEQRRGGGGLATDPRLVKAEGIRGKE